MAAPQITALPTPPVRSDAPADFSSKADAFVAALPGFVTETNSSADFIDGRAVDALASQLAASDSALAASNSAAEALASELAAELASDNLASLDALWLGAASTDPLIGKGGTPLVAGNAYVNTVTGLLRAYNGTDWVQGISGVAGVSSIAGLVGEVSAEQVNNFIRARAQARIVSFF